MIFASPYSYRSDTAVPAFDDNHPVMVFDGICTLCSGGAARLIGWDKQHKFRFVTAQSRLGQALLTHYGCDTVTFNTVLVISEGRGYTKSDSYLEISRVLGGFWRLFLIFRLVPRSLRDAAYDFKARNRYKWFGTAEYCGLIPQDVRHQFLDM